MSSAKMSSKKRNLDEGLMEQKNKKSKAREEVEEDSSEIEVDSNSEQGSEESSNEESSSDDEEYEQTKKPAMKAKAKAATELPPGYICNACKQPGHAIYDCPLKISKTKSEKKVKTTVFMSRLPKKWDLEALVNFLGGADIDTGALVNVKLVMNTSDETSSTGVALVTVAGNETLSKILQLSGQELGGREIIVKIDTPKPKDAKKKRCARCGGLHDMATCNNPRVCYKCKGTDHISKYCSRSVR